MSEKMISEKEYRDYCLYKLIEKDIKGCLDRERKLEKENKLLEKALKFTIKEISNLNNGNVCANNQCADPECDYYTETHNCFNMRRRYWLNQAEKELEDEKFKSI